MSLPPPVPTAPYSAKKTSGLAIAALVCGILSFLGGIALIIPFLLAIIFGHIALSKCNRDPQLGGKGLAIAGLCLGYSSILLTGLLAAMAIPAFHKVRENSMQKVMASDARQIGSAAQMLVLETGKPVIFTIDPATGAVSGPLAQYLPKVSPGMVAVDNTVANEQDGFSLQHPKIYGGREVRFDANGRMISEK